MELDTIVKEVREEIKSIGVNSEKNYKELKNNLDELRRSNDSEKVQKLATDISVRQEEMDKAHNQRMDAIELAMKKIPYIYSEKKDDLMGEARSFYMSALAARNKQKCITTEQVEEMESKVSVDDYLRYKKVFNKLLRVNGDTRALDAAEMKTLQIGIDPDGGYTVTPFMASRITKRIYEIDPIRQLASTQAITTNEYEEIVDWGDAGAEWEGETVSTTDHTTPTFNKKKIVVHALATRPRATQTLLEDSSINIESWLADKIADKFARKEGEAFITGNGVNKPRGILTYSNGTTFGTVEQVNMGHASQLTADGFISIKYSLKEYFLERGTWIMARTTLAAAMKLKDGNGDYLWKPGLLTNDPYSTLLNLPVRMSTTMPAVTANALSVALADWARAYLIVDRLGITTMKDPYTVKPLVEFYTRKRCGADLVDFDAIKIGKISA